MIAGGLTFGRFAIRQALADCSDILVIREARGGAEAADAARQSGADVLIYDASTGADEALRCVALIRRRAPRIRALLLSDDLSGEVLRRAASAGVSRVMGPETTRDELVHAVRRLAPAQQAPVSEVTTRARSGRAHRLHAHRSLSREELSVARAIAEGHTDRQIAAHLAIPVATVKARVRSILKKTSSVNRTGAIAAAFRSRVIE